MKKKNIPVEFVFQLFALIIAIIIVHAFYQTVVRPNAAQIIEEQNAATAADPDYIRERRVAVLIKDLEQEACFILGIWALAIMGYKGVILSRERRLLDVDLVPVAEAPLTLLAPRGGDLGDCKNSSSMELLGIAFFLPVLGVTYPEFAVPLLEAAGG